MAEGIVIGNLTIPVIKGDKGDKGNTGEIISISLVLLSPSSTAYAINNGSTTQAQIELGIPKGLSVSTTNINASGELVFTFNDNSTVNVGKVVGKGISEVTVTDDFDFVVTYTDGTSVTACNLEEEILGAINDILESYYTKTEIDEMGFITKEVNNLTNYYKKDETYTKEEVDNKVASVYKYKGTVATYADLPSLNLTIGDVYNVESDGSNYAWTGTDWDKLGGDIDLSGYQEKIDNSHKLNADLVDDSNSINKFTSATEKNSWNAKYDKPSGGIPSTDMSSSVQTSLGKADTALQAHQDISGKEDSSNKVTSIDENSTNTQYPSAKLVYDELVERDEEINQLYNDHPDITDTGTDITLQGTGDLKMKVDVGGNSTQVQYEGYNLFDESILNQYKVDEDNEAYIFDNSTLERKKLTTNIIFKENTAYTIVYTTKQISGNPRLQIFYTDGSIKNIPNDGAILTNYASYLQVSDLNKTIDYITETYSSNNQKSFYIKKNSVMILEGSYTTETLPDYEPYVGGQASPNPTYKQDINNVEGDVVVKGSSKNLVNWETDTPIPTGTESVLILDLGEDKTFESITTSFILKNAMYTGANNAAIINYEKNDETPQYRIAAQFGTNINTLLNGVYSRTETNITFRYVRVYLLSNYSGFTQGTASIQIEEGSTATPYVPHAENSVTFPLSQGQKLMLGDTLEDDGIHHKRGQYVFTGTETITKNSSSITNSLFYIAKSSNYSAFAKYSFTNFDNVKCNYLTEKSTQLINNNNEEGFNYNNSLQLIYINIKTEENTTDAVKAKIKELYDNGTPLIFELNLNQDDIDSYTPEQQTAYNKLKEMQSYYDLTYVVGSSDNAQPILTAHAKKSIKELSGGDLSNYQTKITSTNKLNSDLVNDTNQTNKFVTTSEKNTWNAKQNTTDNNLATTNKNITSAINEVNSIAKGANQAISYTSYSAMVTAINALASTALNVGQNIYIETLEVPDLWVYKVESTSSSYTYTTDSAFTTALETNGYVQVGYYKLSALETQKVDLTNYVEFTDYASSSTAGVVKISILTQSEYDELQTIDTNTFYMIKEEVLE